MLGTDWVREHYLLFPCVGMVALIASCAASLLLGRVMGLDPPDNKHWWFVVAYGISFFVGGPLGAWGAQAYKVVRGGEVMATATVKTDCCGNSDSYLIGDEFGNGRVRVEGNCPVCGAADPLGRIVETEAAEVKPGCSRMDESKGQCRSVVPLMAIPLDIL